MPEDFVLLGRLLLAAVLGGAIGAERELNDQAAGLRTHMLLTIGACLFTLVSAYGFGSAIGTDPSRLAAQVVTGIGFLGGGAIVRHGLTVKGLTTAASIWATASVGVAVGAGSYVLGIGGAVLVVGTLFGLRRVSNVLQRWGVSREEFVAGHRARVRRPADRGARGARTGGPAWPGAPAGRGRGPGGAAGQAAAPLPARAAAPRPSARGGRAPGRVGALTGAVSPGRGAPGARPGRR